MYKAIQTEVQPVIEMVSTNVVKLGKHWRLGQGRMYKAIQTEVQPVIEMVSTDVVKIGTSED